MDRAETSAPADHLALDGAQLLVVTADLVGIDRALAAARRARGDDGLAALLLLPGACRPLRSVPVDDRGPEDVARRPAGGGFPLTGTEPPELAALRRFSLGGIFLAAAFLLGLYLLVVQLAGVAAMGDVFEGAIWEWVAATALIAQLPPFSQAIAMLGAVATTLPAAAGDRRPVRPGLHRPGRRHRRQRHPVDPLLPEAGPPAHPGRQLGRPQLRRRLRRPDRAGRHRPAGHRVVLRPRHATTPGPPGWLYAARHRRGRGRGASCS